MKKQKYKYDHKDLVPVLAQIFSDNDRTTAIIGGAFVEDGLEQILRMQFMEGGDHSKGEGLNKERAEIIDRMFDSQQNPLLGTFRAKIDMCLALGSIGMTGHKDLVAIKNIRNAFAHNLLAHENKPVSFETQPIKNWCHNLNIVKLLGEALETESTRHQFAHACTLLRSRFDFAMRHAEPMLGKYWLLP